MLGHSWTRGTDQAEPGVEEGIAPNREGLAAGAVAQARSERGARLIGAAGALGEAMGAPLPPAKRADYERSLVSARHALGEKAFASVWAEGRAMTQEQAVAYALE
jgi:hypothetical protein